MFSILRYLLHVSPLCHHFAGVQALFLLYLRAPNYDRLDVMRKVWIYKRKSIKEFVQNHPELKTDEKKVGKHFASILKEVATKKKKTPEEVGIKKATNQLVHD